MINLSSIRSSEFARNVFTLATGTAAAQAITIVASPLLSRIYQPADYGDFALWSAVVSILGLIASGRYENAILLPKDDESAITILHLSVGLTALASAVILFPIVFWNRWIASALGAPALAQWLFLVPPGILIANLTQCLWFWANRRQSYRVMASSRLIGAIVGTAASVAFGYRKLGPVGLIGGAFAGQVAGGIGLMHQFIKTAGANRTAFSLARVRVEARKHKNFPQYAVWSDLMNVGSNQLVVVMLSRCFGVTTLGWYSIGQRVIGVPSSLVGTAILEVFRGRASRDFATQGNCKTVYRETFKRLAILSLVPFLALIIGGPSLFSLVFGEKWRPAGEIARIMSGMYMLRFIVSPLTHTYYLANKQREDLLLHVWILVSSVAVIWIGFHYSHSPKTTLLLFSLNFTSIYIIYLIRSYVHAGTPKVTVVST